MFILLNRGLERHSAKTKRKNSSTLINKLGFVNPLLLPQRNSSGNQPWDDETFYVLGTFPDRKKDHGKTLQK